MKTQSNFSNLKRTGLTVFASLVLTTGMFAANSENNSLSNYFKAQQKQIIYQAPAMTDEYEAAVALEDLESLAVAQFASVKYNAPAIDPEVEVADPLNELQIMADQLTNQVKYTAPESTEFNVVDDLNNETGNWMAQTK